MRTRVTRLGRERLRSLGLDERAIETAVAQIESGVASLRVVDDERDPDLRPARTAAETTGACDAGAHRDCAPSAAMRAAVGGFGCECPCHREEA